MFLEHRKQYLLKNYKDLFFKNYPAANKGSLAAPVATFEKKLDDRYLFKLQCTQSGLGRPLTLIMYYSYNPNTKAWNLQNVEN